MKTWIKVIAALALLAAACDSDDGTAGWTIATSASGDSTSSADDASTTEDTGTVTDTGGTATTDVPTTDAVATDGATQDGATTDGATADGTTTSGDTTPSTDGDVGAEDIPSTVNEPPIFSLVDLNSASSGFATTNGSGKLSGRLVLAVFHNAADSDSRTRAVALEQLRASYEAQGGSQPAIITINELGTGNSIQDYVNQGSTIVQFPVLQDTDEDAVWLAFGAERQDMLLLDLQDGLPGGIVSTWTVATGQLDPTNADDLATLQAAIASTLK